MLKKVDKLITENHWFCDVCEEKAGAFTKCFGCGKDLCSVCGNCQAFDVFDDCPTGDHAKFFCENCEKELDKIKPKLKIIHEQHNLKVQTIEQEFKINCQNVNNK